MTSTDDQLVRQYLNGNMAAFNTLYSNYSSPIYGYLRRNTPDATVADELFQETWTSVVARLDRYKPGGKFRQWLFTIAHNALVDHYRKHREMDELQPGDLTSRHTGDSIEISERIEAAINRLSFEQRQAFLLKQVTGCSLAELSQILDSPRETVKSRLRYAYQNLRKDLKDLL